ncbi:MAG: hypothetical protein PVF05_04755 [Gemmatimonadales bacterium]
MNERQARRAALLGVGLWLLLHLVWIFRTEVNWDEFALLARAHDSLVEGRLIAGGRPGLATLLLLPIVDGCRDAVSAALTARLVWTAFVAAILLGLWGFLGGLFRSRSTRWRDSLWGVSLIALTPAFLHYSLQVRSDQPAIAFGLLGGMALLASRERIPLAALAGVLFGLGFASSQKLVYVAGLVGVLAIAESLVADRFRWRRDVGRVVLVIAGGIATLLAFRAGVSLFMQPAPPTNVGGQLDWFAFYREHVGYGYYLLMLPGLIVPVGLAALVLWLSPIMLWRRRTHRADAGMVLAVLGAGLVVAAFHAGALPYFWMTLGLFPAVAAAIGMPLLRASLGRTKRVVVLVAAGILLGTAVNAGLQEARRTNDVQKQTMALVRDNFPASATGFSTKQALFCQDGPTPFPAYFGPTLHDWTPERIDDFMAEFRERKVAFMVASRDMEVFPERIQDFWAEHYVPYAGALMVAGIEVAAGSAPSISFDVVVPGDYRLHADDTSAAVLLDGAPFAAGDVRRLGAGEHAIVPGAVRGSVLLTLDLPAPPGPTTDRFWSGH